MLLATLLATLLALLAGCDAAGAPTQGATALPPRTVQITPWGAVTLHQLPTALSDNRIFVFENAATPDGQWLLGANEPRDFIQNTTRLSSLVLYNGATGQLITVHALLHPHSQILGVSVDDRWIVWSEADDQPDFFDWALFAYDRQRRTVRQLAQATQVNGQPVAGPSPLPVVSHGRVVWGQAIGPLTPNSLSNAVVRMEDLEQLATGTVTTLASSAGDPSLAWPWIAWAQSTTDSEGYTALKNLETGQRLQLHQQPLSLGIAGKSLAYDDTSAVYLIDDITQDGVHAQLVAKAANEADHLQFVTLNDRLVAWAQESMTQVWDRTLRRLVILPVHDGKSESWVGGRTLVWSEPEAKGQQEQDARNNLLPTSTLNVVDTLTLPSAPK